MESKNYDYYAEVLSDISPILKSMGYGIVQIGSETDPLFMGCYDLRSKTNLYQATYLVKNAKLHLGNDSVWAHVAGAFKVPVVVPYGATYSNVCAPFYHGDAAFIESHRNGKKASCAMTEDPKTINFITPEQISNSVFQLLGIETRVGRQTLFVGRNYNSFKLNIVPISPIIHKEFIGLIADVRADLVYDQNVISTLVNSLKCNVHISQPDTFDVRLLSNKANINSVVVHVESPERAAASVPFLKFIKTNFNYTVRYEGDPALIGMARLHLFDFNFSFEETPKPPIELSTDLWAKSTNLFYADEKIYLSKWHYDNNIYQPSVDINFGLVEDHADFWDGLDNYLLFKK
jgi:hypothetical protein